MSLVQFFSKFFLAILGQIHFEKADEAAVEDDTEEVQKVEEEASEHFLSVRKHLLDP